VLIAAVLPYLTAYLAKAGAYGLNDNDAPRDWAARQSGWRSRANAAQANGFEGLPFFIGAVVIAHQLGAAQGRIDLLAGAYVLLRVIYIGLYVKGIGGARSLVWALGFIANVALLFAGR
jgi:uncharacterized MAPEG superfamily protein